MLRTDLAQNGIEAGKIQEQMLLERYDALRITFTVSADHVLDDPYLVATASYKQSDRKDLPAHSWIFAQSLERIAGPSRRVDILAGGFPAGFVFSKFHLHLYDRGAEVATTVSSNWISMTQEEAFLYIVANYLGSHRTDTMPAAVVMRYPSHNECAAMMQAGAPRELFVKVGRDGMPAGAFLDSACTQAAPEGLISTTVGQLRFTPALENGRPTAGVVRLNLSS